MDANQKIAIASQSSQALFKSLSTHSVSIFDTDDKDDPSGWGLFSGTLVQIGKRVFVATASHCVTMPASSTRYWILPDAPQHASERATIIVAAWKTTGDRPDVGVLELDAASLVPYTSKTPCLLDRLRIEGLGRADRICSLVGTPGQYVQQENIGAGKGLKAVAISYSSSPIGIAEWPTFNASPALDLGIDILMHYPAGTNDTTRLDTGLPIELPDPSGMSGGGLWDQGFNTGKIWSTDEAFLFGIQSAWFPSKRYVRVVQIKHWLRLVHQHYPDLQSEIDGKFPTLHA
jgi:hypothetical protein